MGSQPKTVDAATGKGQACSFMDKLPVEIRKQVYGYLLGAKHATIEHDMGSSDYYQNRDAILDGADHFYIFHLAILGVNRQIRHEAGDLFNRENLFVRFTIEKPALWDISFKQGRLPIIASGDKARHFPITAMSLTFDDSKDCEPWRFVPETMGDRGREDYILHVNDLSTFCTSLLLHCRQNGRHLFTTPLQISIDLRIGHTPADEKDGFPTSRSNLARLLEPLRRLHDFCFVDIAGPGSPTYKADVIKSVRRRGESPNEIIEKGSAALDRGDHLYSESKLLQAMDMYKSGLNVIRGSCFNPEEDNELLKTGYYTGCFADRARDDTDIRLHARIANIYLECKQYRMARIYAERAYGPAHGWGLPRMGFPKFPLCLLPDRGAFPASYAEVLAVAARISEAQGNISEAYSEIFEATRFDPLSEEIESLFEKYDKQAQVPRSKRERRRQAQMLEEKKLLEKAKDQLKVAAYRESKADQALLVGNFPTARACYEAALATLRKTRNMRDRFYWCLPCDIFQPRHGEIDVSMIRLHAKLTSVCLRIKAYRDVVV